MESRAKALASESISTRLNPFDSQFCFACWYVTFPSLKQNSYPLCSFFWYAVGHVKPVGSNKKYRYYSISYDYLAKSIVFATLSFFRNFDFYPPDKLASVDTSNSIILEVCLSMKLLVPSWSVVGSLKNKRKYIITITIISYSNNKDVIAQR